jgi:hypothetical protein
MEAMLSWPSLQIALITDRQISAPRTGARRMSIFDADASGRSCPLEKEDDDR